MIDSLKKAIERLDTDILLLAGASLVFFGLFQIYPPAAFIAQNGGLIAR